MALPPDYYTAGITSDGKGFVTMNGTEPAFRSFEYDPGYDLSVAIIQALERLDSRI
jgi:hypothetical protein